MNHNNGELLIKFKEISNKKWIKGVNNLTNSVGLTFESLLGKKTDSLYFPDYNGIEIKCTQRFSRYPITLFTSVFDGPEMYEMNTILQKYGENDSFYRNKKMLNSPLSCKNKVLFNDKFYFKLDVLEKSQKIFFSVYDKNHKLIERKSFIKFETLKNRLEIKLSTLAIVWASKKTLNNDLYFRYYRIIIYKLISFEKFIELLKNDIIIVNIVGRISRSGIDAGRQRNKNLVFKIGKEYITELFNIVKEYNNDLESTL